MCLPCSYVVVSTTPASILATCQDKLYYTCYLAFCLQLVVAQQITCRPGLFFGKFETEKE